MVHKDTIPWLTVYTHSFIMNSLSGTVSRQYDYLLSNTFLTLLLVYTELEQRKVRLTSERSGFTSLFVIWLPAGFIQWKMLTQECMVKKYIAHFYLILFCIIILFSTCKVLGSYSKSFNIWLLAFCFHVYKISLKITFSYIAQGSWKRKIFSHFPESLNSFSENPVTCCICY